MDLLKKMLYFDERVIFSYYGVFCVAFLFYLPRVTINYEALKPIAGKFILSLVISILFFLPFILGFFCSLKHIFTRLPKKHWEVNYMAVTIGIFIMLVSSYNLIAKIKIIAGEHLEALRFIQILTLASLSAYTAICGFLLFFLTAVWSENAIDTTENEFFNYDLDISKLEVAVSTGVIVLLTWLLKEFTARSDVEIININLFYCMTINRFIVYLWKLFFKKTSNNL